MYYTDPHGTSFKCSIDKDPNATCNYNFTKSEILKLIYHHNNINEPIPDWLKHELTEKITNCELLAAELLDKRVGNGTTGDIEEAVRL
jgi:hypothetical protein